MDYLYALQCLREAGPEFVNYIFLFISEVFFLGGVVVACYIYWCADKYAGRAILMGYGTTCFVNQTVKNIACVYRPWILDSRLHVDPAAAGSATGYSFPSGHTSSSAAVYGGISIWQRKRRWVVVLMSLAILLVAFSRNWLGAHTIQDVLVGALIAAVMLSVCAFFRFWLAAHPEKDTFVCFGAIAVAAVVLVILSLKPYPVDYSADGSILVDPYHMLTDCYTATGVICGAFLGMWLERHFLHFDVSTSRSEKIVIFLGGALLIGIIYTTFSFVFSFLGEHWCHFVKYFAMFITILYVYPLIFSFVRSRRRL